MSYGIDVAQLAGYEAGEYDAWDDWEAWDYYNFEWANPSLIGLFNSQAQLATQEFGNDAVAYDGSQLESYDSDPWIGWIAVPIALDNPPDQIPQEFPIEIAPYVEDDPDWYWSQAPPTDDGEVIFPVTLPVNPDFSDPGTQYELGTKFQASVPGLIVAIRFYKAARDTGTTTRVGRLWTSGGTQLAQITFTGESAEGWQEQALTTPIFISPNTTYVVSANVSLTGATAAFYAFTSAGLATSQNNGNHLSTVADGANGVFITTEGAFPTGSNNNTNYFRDVRFITTQDFAQNTVEAAGNAWLYDAQDIEAGFDEPWLTWIQAPLAADALAPDLVQSQVDDASTLAFLYDEFGDYDGTWLEWTQAPLSDDVADFLLAAIDDASAIAWLYDELADYDGTWLEWIQAPLADDVQGFQLGTIDDASSLPWIVDEFARYEGSWLEWSQTPLPEDIQDFALSSVEDADTLPLYDELGEYDGSWLEWVQAPLADDVIAPQDFLLAAVETGDTLSWLYDEFARYDGSWLEWTQAPLADDVVDPLIAVFEDGSALLLYDEFGEYDGSWLEWTQSPLADDVQDFAQAQVEDGDRLAWLYSEYEPELGYDDTWAAGWTQSPLSDDAIVVTENLISAIETGDTLWWLYDEFARYDGSWLEESLVPPPDNVIPPPVTAIQPGGVDMRAWQRAYEALIGPKGRREPSKEALRVREQREIAREAERVKAHYAARRQALEARLARIQEEGAEAERLRRLILVLERRLRMRLVLLDDELALTIILAMLL